MYRILLVDDEILVRDAIKENIDWKSMDCELVGDCENGKQAAEFVQEHPVDIVLTDILMPYMDGMELSHFLHDNYPDVVIVVFSGFGDPVRRQRVPAQTGNRDGTDRRHSENERKSRSDPQRKKKNGITYKNVRELPRKCTDHSLQDTGSSCKLYRRYPEKPG